MKKKKKDRAVDSKPKIKDEYTQRKKKIRIYNSNTVCIVCGRGDSLLFGCAIKEFNLLFPSSITSDLSSFTKVV